LRRRTPSNGPHVSNTLGRGLFRKMRGMVEESTSGASFLDPLQ
jgi:hypothetical protein